MVNNSTDERPLYINNAQRKISHVYRTQVDKFLIPCCSWDHIRKDSEEQRGSVLSDVAEWPLCKLCERIAFPALKPYMGYSRAGGSWEGAVLIFAHNKQEAKKIGWPVLSGWNVDEFTDVAIRSMSGSDHLFALADQKKLEASEEHVIDNPESCESCKYWGYGVDADGICDSCGQPSGFSPELVEHMRDFSRNQKPVMTRKKLTDIVATFDRMKEQGSNTGTYVKMVAGEYGVTVGTIYKRIRTFKMKNHVE